MKKDPHIQNAMDTVQTMQHGRDLALLFNSAVQAGINDDRPVSAKQHRLNAIVADINPTELTSFAALYAVALRRLELTEQARVVYEDWNDLTLQNVNNRTISTDEIEARVQKAFADAKGGVLVIRNAYNRVATGEGAQQAIRIVEDTIARRMQSHPLVIMSGTSADLKDKHLSGTGTFARKIGF